MTPRHPTAGSHSRLFNQIQYKRTASESLSLSRGSVWMTDFMDRREWPSPAGHPCDQSAPPGPMPSHQPKFTRSPRHTSQCPTPRLCKLLQARLGLPELMLFFPPASESIPLPHYPCNRLGQLRISSSGAGTAQVRSRTWTWGSLTPLLRRRLSADRGRPRCLERENNQSRGQQLNSNTTPTNTGGKCTGPQAQSPSAANWLLHCFKCGDLTCPRRLWAFCSKASALVVCTCFSPYTVRKMSRALA
jgi:hypothetical protein